MDYGEKISMIFDDDVFGEIISEIEERLTEKCNLASEAAGGLTDDPTMFVAMMVAMYGRMRQWHQIMCALAIEGGKVDMADFIREEIAKIDSDIEL